MQISQNLKIKQSQSLVMTPQLQQAIKLLQLNNIELCELVNKELEENPFLENESESIDKEATDRDNEEQDGTENILDAFDINVNFPVIYFTRQFPYTDTFKVGFDQYTYQKFNSKFYEKVMKIIDKLVSELNGVNAIILAGDFDKEGNFIDETINVEIIPYQNKDNYFIIRDILIQNYEVVEDKISRYDKMFVNYEIFDFCWHTKIKLYNDRKPVVKFYRTYPHNPFIGYHNYK